MGNRCSARIETTSCHVHCAAQEGGRMRYTLNGKNIEVTPDLTA
jgi:hypothetical protein